MNDRELLTLAAKAAGREIHHWSTILSGPMLTDAETGDCSHYWNPLEEDGDALRLAVKLRLHVTHDTKHGCVDVECNSEDYCASEYYRDNAEAAVRRAIVLAAAHVGRSA